MAKACRQRRIVSARLKSEIDWITAYPCFPALYQAGAGASNSNDRPRGRSFVPDAVLTRRRTCAGKCSDDEPVRVAEDYRLADRRRQIRRQSEPHDGGNLRTPGAGRLAALARRRFRADAASGYFRRQFHLAAGRRGRRRQCRFRSSQFAAISKTARWRSCTTRDRRSDIASMIPRASAFRSLTTCGRRASPTISRCRFGSPAARFTQRAGPRSSRAVLAMTNWLR